MPLVQEGMLSFGKDLGLAPATALSLEQADPVTLRSHLRDGVTFHDGRKLTTDDVVATMLWNASGSQLAAFYSAVSSVEATGPSEVAVKLKTPNVQFQYTPAHMAGYIFKKTQIDSHAQDMERPPCSLLAPAPTSSSRPSRRPPSEQRNMGRVANRICLFRGCRTAAHGSLLAGMPKHGSPKSPNHQRDR
jgi:Bacterial extracellular solute-binding proteins, family 5 Middle